jgi:hypothetical protein
MFEASPEDGRAYIREEELLRHALDDDVEHAVRSLMRYAAARRPDDNTSISMLFVPSRARRPVRVGGGLSRRQKYGLGAASSIIVLVARCSVSRPSRPSQKRHLRSTEDRIREIVFSFSSRHRVAHRDGPLSPTARPTLVAENQIGFSIICRCHPAVHEPSAFARVITAGRARQPGNPTRTSPPLILLADGRMVDLQMSRTRRDRNESTSCFTAGRHVFNGDSPGRRRNQLQQNPNISSMPKLCASPPADSADYQPDDTDKPAPLLHRRAKRLPSSSRRRTDAHAHRTARAAGCEKRTVSTGPLVYEEVKTYFLDTVYALTQATASSMSQHGAYTDTTAYGIRWMSADEAERRPQTAALTATG